MIMFDKIHLDQTKQHEPESSLCEINDWDSCALQDYQLKPYFV